MPVYPMKCKKCEKEFEVEMSFDDYDKFKAGNNKICECGGEAERQFKSGTLITHYACGGFYQTDYGKGRYD